MLEHRYDKRNEQVDFVFLLLKLRGEEMMSLIVVGRCRWIFGCGKRFHASLNISIQFSFSANKEFLLFPHYSQFKLFCYIDVNVMW